MKKYFSTLLVLLLAVSLQAQNYVPTPQNVAARKAFTNEKYGLFIHWGPFSIPGSGDSSNRRYLIEKERAIITSSKTTR